MIFGVIFFGIIGFFGAFTLINTLKNRKERTAKEISLSTVFALCCMIVGYGLAYFNGVDFITKEVEQIEGYVESISSNGKSGTRSVTVAGMELIETYGNNEIVEGEYLYFLYSPTTKIIKAVYTEDELFEELTSNEP